jgi:hypothetical protein
MSISGCADPGHVVDHWQSPGAPIRLQKQQAKSYIHWGGQWLHVGGVSTPIRQRSDFEAICSTIAQPTSSFVSVEGHALSSLIPKTLDVSDTNSTTETSQHNDEMEDEIDASGLEARHSSGRSHWRAFMLNCYLPHATVARYSFTAVGV